MYKIFFPSRAVLTVALCLLATACGGNSGGTTADRMPAANSPALMPENDDGRSVLVGKVEARFLVDVPADAHRKAFAEAGIIFISATCYDVISPSGPDNSARAGLPDPILYVYEIRQKDLVKATELDFTTQLPTKDFKSAPRVCYTERERVIPTGPNPWEPPRE